MSKDRPKIFAGDIEGFVKDLRERFKSENPTSESDPKLWKTHVVFSEIINEIHRLRRDSELAQPNT